VITGDLADVNIPEGLSSSCTRLPAVIDDMFICAQVTVIDGTGGILGSAGPEYVRSGSGTALIGSIKIDVADAANLVANGKFEGVIVSALISCKWTDSDMLWPVIVSSHS